MLFSILRATSFSSWPGVAPGSAATTFTVGRSRSGKFCTFIEWKANRPPSVSSTNSIRAGTGLRIDQAETFMRRDSSYWVTLADALAGLAELAVGAGALDTWTRSPSFRNPAPRTATA